MGSRSLGVEFRSLALRGLELMEQMYNFEYKTVKSPKVMVHAGGDFEVGSVCSNCPVCTLGSLQAGDFSTPWEILWDKGGSIWK